MIFRLKGKVVDKNSDSIVIDVNGVAYEAMISLSTFSTTPPVGEDIELYTHMVVREDGVYLYGFSNLSEKRLFLDLITVSGIGAKLSIKILGGVGVNNFREAISKKDYNLLTNIPGVGKKTAERIIVELKDKFDKMSFADDNVNVSAGVANDVALALVNLGYKMADARKAVESSESVDDFEMILRDALKFLTSK